eukprot:TRINITY_DN18291_c0_g1_i1.p1 TRINITY_DN18291_c0_g1~~TRINITY_DN18291_c0_g1_i1.p1  ORF type:complete len:112 (-),score=12.17 TRINITY_DN18291_c0_g1_i1:344-679(-)
MSAQIQYSEKYQDSVFEYRHVILPTSYVKELPKNRLLSEDEWRALGVQQSRGWEHYAVHRPEPHVLLFRRPLGYGTAAQVTQGTTNDASGRRAQPRQSQSELQEHTDTSHG